MQFSSTLPLLCAVLFTVFVTTRLWTYSTKDGSANYVEQSRTIFRRLLGETHYLRSQPNPEKNQEIQEDPPVLEMNDKILAYSNGANPEETADSLNHVQDSGIRLQNFYSADVFPGLRSLESHILNEHAVLSEFREFKQDKVIKLFKSAVSDGFLTKCPDYKQSNVGVGNNIYDGVEKAIEAFHPIYLIEFSSTKILTSLTNYISIKFPELVSIKVHYDALSSVNGESSSDGSHNQDDDVNADCKQTFSSNNAFTVIGENFQQLELSYYNESQPTIDHNQCVQYLEDYRLLTKHLLPFEYEKELGIFLCRCSVNYLPNNFPLDDPFFAHWENPIALYYNAIDAVDSCFQKKSVTKQDQSESYTSPVKYFYDVIVSIPDNSTDSNPDTSSSSSTSFRSTYWSSSSRNAPSPSPLETKKEIEPTFPWRVLSRLSLDSKSRTKFANKVVYDKILKDSESWTEAETTPSSSQPEMTPHPTSVSLSTAASTTSVTPVTTTSNSAYPSRYVSTIKTEDTADRVPVNDTSASNLNTPIVVSDVAGFNNKTIDDDAVANVTVNFKSNNHHIIADQLSPAQRRRLWPLTSSSSSASKILSNNGRATSSATSSSSKDEDRLDAKELNFAWKLLDEKHQILDLHSHDGNSHDGNNANHIDEIHEEIVKYYHDILEEEKIEIKPATQFTSGYYLTEKSRRLQKLIYKEEKAVYQRWMELADHSHHHGDKENNLSLLWKDLSTAKLVYSLGEKLSLASLKLTALLSSPSSFSSSKIQRKRKASLHSNDISRIPENTNFFVSSFFVNEKKAQTHYKLSKVMNVHNHLVFQPNWNMKLLLSWISSPERADVALIETDIIFQVISIVYEYSVQLQESEGIDNICCLDPLYEGLSVLLSLSRVSYLHLPSLKEFLQSLEIIAPLCYDEWEKQLFTTTPSSSSSSSNTAYEGFLERIFSKLNFSFDITIDTLHSKCDENISVKEGNNAENIQFYRIEINHRAFSSIKGKVTQLPTLFETKSSSNGISLYSLSAWNIIHYQKSKFYSLFINLPLWNLKDYFLHHDASSNPTNTGGNNKQFHSNYQHDQQINLHQLAPWNIYINIINSLQTWQISIVTLHINHEDRSVSSNELISITSDIEEKSNNREKKKNNKSSSSSSFQSIQQEIMSSKKIYEILETEFQHHSSELANGYFSFLEHHSGVGYVSSRLSQKYSNATIFSMDHHENKVNLHYLLSKRLNIENNAICYQDIGSSGTLSSSSIINKFYSNLYDCPELFRFQLLFNNLLQQFIYEVKDINDWGENMGTILSSALTSFVYVPNPALVSYGFTNFYGLVFLYYDKKTQITYTPSELLLLQQQEKSGASEEIGGAAPSFKDLQSIYLEKKFPYRMLEEVILKSDHENAAVQNTADTVIPPHHDHQPRNNLQEYLYQLTYLSSHPQLSLQHFQSEWLLSSARINNNKKGFTSLLISPLLINDHHQMTSSRRGSISQPVFFDFPMIRCDIVNMTRHVHHHYDYAKDGHSRTYTMRVQVNKTETARVKQLIVDPSTAVSRVDQSGVHLSLSSFGSSSSDLTLQLGHHPSQHNIVSVRLYRDKDDWPIPYVSIYGVTLITALRLGLLPQIRERLFHSFLKLPLYEDMAPWNIVLMGPTVDYIDYDTREFTFDKVIPKAYQVMTVLMNYKRTVEDFKKCGSKAGTVYGLPYVSDCVGGFATEKQLQCSSDLRYPVPCSDGKCHSDYISCLRSLSDIAQRIEKDDSKPISSSEDPILHQLVSSMSSVVAKFNPTSYSEVKYEDFLNQLSE